MSPLKETTNGKLYDIFVNAHKNGTLSILIVAVIAWVFYKWVEDGRKQDRLLFQEAVNESKKCSYNTIYLLTHQLEASTEVNKAATDAINANKEMNERLLKHLESN